MEPGQGFSSILSGEVAGVPQGPAYGPMQQPQPDISAMQRPATTPEELEARKSGWQQLLANPNFMRAVGFMGAQLAQPIQPGQSKLGHLGQAFNTGQTALQMGEYAQYEQDMAAKKEARAQTESEASVASTKAGTQLKTAQLPGVQAESTVAAATTQAKIAEHKAKSEKAIFDLGKAKSAEEVDKIEREVKQRKLAIQKEIPDASLRAAAMAEVESTALKAREARARISASEASASASRAAAGASGVETTQKQITVDVLKKMDAQERKEFLTKTKRYSQHTSGVGQQATMWGDIYDKLPETDKSKQGRTREQFQMERLTQAKGQDALKLLTDYLKNTLDPDPDIVEIYTNAAKQAGSQRPGVDKGAEAGAEAGAGAKAPPQIRDAAGYAKLKKGDRYIDPRGVERVKK